MTQDELDNQKKMAQEASVNNTLVRGGAALFGSLLGLGASPDVASRAYQQSGQFLKDTQPASVKDLKEVDVDGRPVYLSPEQAQYQQAYVKPSATSMGGRGSFQAVSTYNPATKEYGSYKFNTGTGETTPMDVIVRPTPEKVFKTKDIQGTTSQKTYNQYDKSPVKTRDVQAGPGKYYGVETEEQAKTIEKGILKGQEESQKLSDSLYDVKDSKRILSTSNDPREIAKSVYELIRATEPRGILTDQDIINISGTDKQTLLSRLQQDMNARFTGDLQTYKSSYATMVNSMERKLSDKLASVGKRYAPSSKQGQKAMESVTPKADMPTLDWKLKYK